MYCSYNRVIESLFSTLFMGYLNYQHTQNRLFRHLFKEFNERYNLLSDGFQALEDKCDPGIKLDDIDKKDLKNIIKYLNLCAEEYLLFDRERINIGARESWRSGMQVWAKLPAVKVVFDDKVATRKTSYYVNFQTFFKDLM